MKGLRENSTVRRHRKKRAYEKFTCITGAFVRKYESVEKYIKNEIEGKRNYACSLCAL